MAETDLASRPPAPPQHRPIAIVASLYNLELVDGLVNSARAELEAISPGKEVPVFRVPGSYEIPSTVEHLVRRGSFGAIIALGVIIRGKTAHADLIGEAVTHSLQEISVRHDVPVIHEVLLVGDEAQARERCLGENLNRGLEAARSAVRMCSVFQEIELAYPDPQPTTSRL